MRILDEVGFIRKRIMKLEEETEIQLESVLSHLAGIENNIKNLDAAILQEERDNYVQVYLSLMNMVYYKDVDPDLTWYKRHYGRHKSLVQKMKLPDVIPYDPPKEE